MLVFLESWWSDLAESLASITALPARRKEGRVR